MVRGEEEEAKAVAKEEVKDRNMIHGDGEEAKAVAKEEVKDKNMADGNGRGGTPVSPVPDPCLYGSACRGRGRLLGGLSASVDPCRCTAT